MKRYGAAVLGTGEAATGHLKAYASNANVDFVAILSRNAEGARAKAAALGVNAAVYTDYAKLLADERVDVVSVCTPNHLHAEQATQAVQAGKHILVEKPLATTLADVHAVRAAVKRAGVKAMVGFVLHWTPLFRLVQRLLEDEAIGRVFLAEVHYWEPGYLWTGWTGYEWWTRKAAAGSSFLTGGCHAVDAIRTLVGEIAEVMAYSTKTNTDFDYDPTVMAVVRFENGAIGKLASTLEAVMPFDFHMTLMGTNGTIRDNRLFSRKLPGQTAFATIPVALPSEGPGPPFPDEIGAFLECIAEDREPPLDIDDAVRTHEVILAIDRSAAEGRPVKLPLQ